jgi:hypothetical protein
MELTAVVPSRLEAGERLSLSLLGSGFGARFDTLSFELAIAGVAVATTAAIATSDRTAGANPLILVPGLYDATLTREVEPIDSATLVAALNVFSVSAWLTADQYKAWARITDTVDDEAIDAAVTAVMAKFATLLRPETFYDDGSVPGDVSEAGLLYVNRLMSRRNSPDGVVGVADLGTAAILPVDADIKRLVSQYTAMVLA